MLITSHHNNMNQQLQILQKHEFAKSREFENPYNPSTIYLLNFDLTVPSNKCAYISSSVRPSFPKNKLEFALVIKAMIHLTTIT